MSVTGLKFGAIDGGVVLVIERDDGQAEHVPMNLPTSQHLFMDLWKALGSHFPRNLADQPDDVAPPRMLDIGDLSLQIGAQSEGLVYLWVRPDDCAGINYLLDPAMAREWARTMSGAADMAEEIVKPRN